MLLCRNNDPENIRPSDSPVLQKMMAVAVPEEAPELPERYRRKHKQCLIESSAAQTRQPRKLCASRQCANKKTQWKCIDCNKPYCKDDQGNFLRNCYYAHICQAFNTSGEASKEWKEEYKKCETQRVAIITQENEQLQARQEDRTQNN
jgi:hypothetical protein